MTTRSEEGSPSISLLDGMQSTMSTKAPKFGLMIPNRIFVGGITGNTTDAELRQFFSTFGVIKDCKIITDRAGVSKGYGFVTFAELEDAEKLIQKEGEHHLIFKDRKLNIGPAVRKQQAQMVAALPQFPQLYESPAAGPIVYANGLPYTLQNSVAMYQVPESYGLPGGMPQVMAPSYPFILPQQQNIAHPGYYQTQPAAAGPAGLQLSAAASPTWPYAAQNIGLPIMTGGSHMTMAGVGPGGQLAVGPAAGLDQYVYQLPTMLSAQDMSSHFGGLHYQRVDLDQPSMLDPLQNEGSIITDPNIVSGHLQYVDIQRLAASALSANSCAAAVANHASTSRDNNNILLSPSGNIQKPSTQNYGVKRVLSFPHDVIQSSSTHQNYGNLYGIPPIKIFAGQDRQRIITQTVLGGSEIQIIPKTQS